VARRFERRSTISLALFADVVRVLEPEQTPVKDLPFATSVS
jgi:hypothetical protein